VTETRTPLRKAGECCFFVNILFHPYIKFIILPAIFCYHEKRKDRWIHRRHVMSQRDNQSKKGQRTTHESETTQLPPRAAMPIYERDVQDNIPWMVGFKIADTRHTVELQITESTTLGRQWSDETTHVNLVNYGAHSAGVSRVHAKLRVRKNHLAIVDLGSTNGTYLNGYRVEPFVDIPIQDGDLIELGELRLQVTFLVKARAS
jgi:hypothetical protein